MNKIEVGEYVKTRYGEIGKLQKITIEPEVDIGIEIMPEVTAYWLNQYTYVEKKDIVKHSKDIIDLIEVGDYVNGEKIIQISKTFGYLFTEKTYYDETTGEERHSFIKEDDVKSIVTKEMMKQIEYRIK